MKIKTKMNVFGILSWISFSAALVIAGLILSTFFFLITGILLVLGVGSLSYALTIESGDEE